MNDGGEWGWRGGVQGKLAYARRLGYVFQVFRSLFVASMSMIARFALLLCLFASAALGKVNYAEVRTKVAQAGAVFGDLLALASIVIFAQAYAEKAHELASRCFFDGLRLRRLGK